LDFNKIKLKLLFHYKNIKDVYKLLQEGTGVRNINIFFYDEKRELFFDQIDKIVIHNKFLKNNSIIGKSYLTKESIFITNIEKDKNYNLALDNPFKLDIENQIVIPIIYQDKVIGILRLSHLPYCFTQSDFENMKILDNIFKKIFLEDIVYENDIKTIKQSASEKIELFTTLSQMKKMFEKVSTCCEHKEIDKFIKIGQENLDNILAYVNPNIDNLANIEEEKHQNNNSVNILIADDIHLNVQILKAMLSGNKIINKIEVAYDGIEAIDILENSSKKIDILFLDHHMPGMLGSEIAQRVKSEKSKLKKIIIISITNDTAILENDKHLYDYHIPKPFTRDNVKKIMSLIYKKD